jgi:hypothetical protein
MHCTDAFIIPSRLYMFRAMFSPIIRSTWLYLQYLVVFTQVASCWCPEWVETELRRLWGVYKPIIRSTWLYLQHLVVFTQVASCWCPEWVETELRRLWGVYKPIIRSTW